MFFRKKLNEIEKDLISRGISFLSDQEKVALERQLETYKTVTRDPQGKELIIHRSKKSMDQTSSVDALVDKAEEKKLITLCFNGDKKSLVEFWSVFGFLGIIEFKGKIKLSDLKSEIIKSAEKYS